MLQREVLSDGLSTREEADVLIALDRAATEADPAWAAYLVTAVVDFVVWGSRPTGYVDQDTARWLVTSLSCGQGPTRTACRIAFEAVKEAEQVDETLLTFVMHDARRAGRPVAVDMAA